MELRRVTAILLILIVCLFPGCSSRIATDEGPDSTIEDDTVEKSAQNASEQRKAAEAAAKKLLKTPIDVQHPPSISLKCHHATEKQEDAIIDKFIEEFNKPELEVFLALISSATDTELTTGELPDRKFTLELRVLNRLIEKANTLITKYRGDEDKYIAVSRAAFSVEKRYQLLAGSGEDNSLLPKLSAWAKEIAEKYLRELKENHEYKNIHPIFKIAREAGLLGVDMGKYVNEDLRKALMFKIEYTNKMNSGRDWSFAYEVTGEAPLDLSLATTQISAFEGEGIGRYVNFMVNGLEGGEAVMDNIAETFPIHFVVDNFNPCESDTFNIYMDRFGLGGESITMIPEEPDIPPKTVTGPAVQGGTEYSFQENKQGDLYKFTVDLNNGNKNAAEKTFTASNERVEVELTLKLIHTP